MSNSNNSSNTTINNSLKINLNISPSNSSQTSSTIPTNQVPNMQFSNVQPQFQMNNNNLFSNQIQMQTQSTTTGYTPNYQQNNLQETVDYSNKNFKDDDEISKKETNTTKNETPNFNLHDIMSLNVKTNKLKVKLDRNNDRKIPIHVSYTVTDTDFNLANRANVDLVCVIDKSGSMQGEKMQLVKDSFKYLLELLGDNDRLSVIIFENSSARISNLTRTTNENKIILQQNINKITAGGGTNINSGVSMALEVLKQRRFKNEQASIFVLSDGCDNVGKNAKTAIKNTIEKYEQDESIIGSYTINTFGYGKDTDSETMSGIADLKDGTFFFIDKLEMIDECFVDCLGAIITSVGQNVNIVVSSQSSEIFNNINFSRGMGGNKLWVWNNSKTEFNTKVTKIIVGKTKDFILELTIPKTNYTVESLTEVQVVNVVLTAETFNVGGNVEIIKKTAELKIKVFSDNIDDKEEDEVAPELVVNYFRLKLAEIMQEARDLAEKQKYDEAKKLLNSLQEELINSKFIDNEKIKLLIEEIKIAVRDVQPEVYTVSGSHNIISNMNCNLKQKSAPTNVQHGNYSNSHQMMMNNNLKMQKK